jgi:hypothetical protein
MCFLANAYGRALEMLYCRISLDVFIDSECVGVYTDVVRTSR